MDGFVLSPGITPALVGLFVVELPVLVGIAYVIWGRPGVEAAFAANALVLGGIKLATDLADLPDLVVAAAGIVGGTGVVVQRWAPPLVNRLGPIATWGGVLLVAVGAFKVARDFYDPFDLLLADCCVVSGLWLALRGSRPRSPARTTGVLSRSDGSARQIGAQEPE